MKQIFLVLLLLSSYSSFSQQKGVYVLKRPVKYIDNNNGEIENSNAQRDNDQHWIVASDRNNNPTFSNENGTGQFKTMSFLECFWVTEDKGDFVHLYKLDPNEFQLEETRRGRPAKLVKGLNDYGWASKSSLLLWFRAVINERQLSKRALPVLKFENIDDDKFKVKEGVIQLFKDPRLSVLSDKQVRMFQFLYIYKEDIVNNSILVGLSYKTADRQIQNDVLGWVHKGILQSWGDRICLEPNWDDKAVSKRKSLNTKAAIFTSLEDAKAFKSGNVAKANEAEWNNDTYGNRMHPNEKRFPILSSETGVDGIVKTGFVTALLDGDSKIVASSAENAITVREGNLNILEKRKVNLIIAVDGSSGMEEYIGAAKEAINQIKERVERKNSEDQDLDDEDMFKYKYGAVVYRNIEDRNCSEDLSVETTPLSTDAGNVISFLSTRSKSSCNPGEKKSGALLLGLYNALRMFQDVEDFSKQTNVLVLIGGKNGMPTGGLSDEKIADLMFRTNTHLMCFQVKTNQDEVFQSFPNKMISIFSLAKDKYNQSRPTDLGVYTSQFKPFGERCYKLDYPEGSTVQGILAYSSLTDFFSTNAIYGKVDSLMKSTEQKLEADIQELSTKFNGVGNRKIKMNAVVANFLVQLGKQVKDRDIVKKYRGNNYQFFIPGYTSLVTNSITEEDGIYKKVLYLTTEELAEMIKSIGELNLTGSGKEIRTKLKNAFRQILINYLGDKGANNAMKNNDLDYVVKLITGLPTNNPFLKGHKIDDFDNTQKMNENEVLNLQRSFSVSYAKLKGALNDDQLVETEPWGKFYWIAEDLLPQ